MPICWKCANAILVDDTEWMGAKVLVGCKEEPKITNWEQAQALCPILKPNALLKKAAKTYKDAVESGRLKTND